MNVVGGPNMTGTVVRVLLNKGYAFVRGDDGVSRFAHAKDFVPQVSFDTLREGQGVSFTPIEDSSFGGNSQRAVEIQCL